jgi:hypothetical protein
MICDIITDLQGGWTNYYPEGCFFTFCDTGANELLPYFQAAMNDRTNAIWQIPLPFDCATAYDKASALSTLLANTNVQQHVVNALDIALYNWGYDKSNPQPTEGMTNALNSCLSTFVSNACVYLRAQTNAPACAPCTP